MTFYLQAVFSGFSQKAAKNTSNFEGSVLRPVLPIMLHLFKIHNMFIYYCEYDAAVQTPLRAMRLFVHHCSGGTLPLREKRSGY